jgi:hypothetical protein
MTTAVVASLSFAAALAQAAPNPKVTGGGVTRNYNSVSPYGTLHLLTFSGFNGQATGPGVLVPFPPFGVMATIYPGRGQMEWKTVLEDDPSTTLADIHGRVVCIANLGPSGLIDGDDPNDAEVADPLGDVWEIRFQITRITGQVLPPVPIYGSVFVQDGGQTDFADESFSTATILNPSCAVNPFFGLEPHLAGNITVH